MDMISIAKVLKPQGIKGELKCKSLTEKLDIFSNLSTVFCDNKEIKVILSVYRLGYVYIMLETCKDRNQAELFRNKIFYIPKLSYGALSQDSYFIEDLIGCDVFDTNNEKIGKVINIENYGASDILIIKEQWYTSSVPFIKKVFIDISPRNKKLVVDMAEYKENKV